MVELLKALPAIDIIGIRLAELDLKLAKCGL
jgi:hypothetical protein